VQIKPDTSGMPAVVCDYSLAKAVQALTLILIGTPLQDIRDQSTSPVV
jgi:hypothetical protein